MWVGETTIGDLNQGQKIETQHFCFENGSEMDKHASFRHNIQNVSF